MAGHLLGATQDTRSSGALSLVAGMRLGRYLILEQLGSGGMGVVYRARDEKLEREVAVKTFSPGMLSNHEARRRFRKEALALAKLSHAHIAALYDVGQENDVDYLVMECVPGESLATRLKAGAMTVKEATKILLQIAEALDEAHERGVVHRDLKPANVMITPKGQAKVLDFGIAKLLAAGPEETAMTTLGTQGLLGTPVYMSPEQALGKDLDERTDLWSLGVVYYEALAGSTPFQGKTSMSVLRAVIDETPFPVRQMRPEIPVGAERIVNRALEKDVASRYQTASEMVRDASVVLRALEAASSPAQRRAARWRSGAIAACLACVVAICGWLLYRSSRRHWAKEDAVPQIKELIANERPLAAYLLMDKARRYLPDDPDLKQMAEENSNTTSVTSSPSGATVEIKDYGTPDAPWHRLGVTPLAKVDIPTGYFRWKLSARGVPDLITAPESKERMDFNLDAAIGAPSGMVLASGGSWLDLIAFVGWLGPYNLPPFYIDRNEVTNAEYQKFVDSGGYDKREYWPHEFVQDGRKLTWEEAIAFFRDNTDRPGPSTWAAGHYPEGEANFPVTGVSWFEASAYASFVGKQLPLVSQWFQAAPNAVASYSIRTSNISGTKLVPVGTSQGLGPYGTDDLVGNAREWIANPVDGGMRFLLGGSWKSPTYLSAEPEALTPFDRSETNGFRCVRNIEPPPIKATQVISRQLRDFGTFKPASDEVFHAYELLYAYPKDLPLNVKVEGVVNETADWREEKISFDTAYGERMAAYLFLPKKVSPPYQTVLFFPSARVTDLLDSNQLGDISFFDYVVQSGRAVMYPIYQDTYERRVRSFIPGASQRVRLTSEWYKDAARSLDYLATRSDIDSGKLVYMGVSMGSAFGAIITTLLQDRLKTAIFLDGGFFLDPPSPGGDQADFVPRLKIPVLMVNGRYDYSFSLRESQDPFFAMLGTPSTDKSHVLLESPHDVRQQRPKLIKAVLEWLDKYLGRVNASSRSSDR